MGRLARAGLLLLALTAPSHALDNALDTTIGYRAPEAGWRGGFYGELGLWSTSTRALSFGMGLGVTRSDYDGPGLRRGPITMVPLTLRSRLKLGSGPLTPYLEGGFGYFLINHDISDAAQRSCANQGKTCADKVENAFGGSLGGGMLFNFAANAALNFSVSGLFVKTAATAETTYNDTRARTASTRMIKLDSVVVAVRTMVRF